MSTQQQNKKEPLKITGSVDDILKMAYGGKPDAGGGQDLSSGAKAEGPSHEAGGIDVGAKGEGEPMAEIEGGERVFSKEDTAALEAAAEQIIQLQEAGDTAGAEDMAKRLGFAVVNMIAAQEESQQAQEQQMGARQESSGQPSAAEASGMDEFIPAEQ